jgi:hypothetical protein
VVRFVPANDAAGLVQSVGSAIPYTSRETSIERFGKRKDGRFYYYPLSILVDAKIGGVDSPRTALILHRWGGTYDAQLELAGATYLQLGDPRSRTRVLDRWNGAGSDDALQESRKRIPGAATSPTRRRRSSAPRSSSSYDFAVDP